jgi:stage II sporulation protein D
MEVLRRSVIFRGMGEGLGVGMCLYGADGLAKKGWNYKDILKFYYKDITIK